MPVHTRSELYHTAYLPCCKHTSVCGAGIVFGFCRDTVVQCHRKRCVWDAPAVHSCALMPYFSTRTAMSRCTAKTATSCELPSSNYMHHFCEFEHKCYNVRCTHFCCRMGVWCTNITMSCLPVPMFPCSLCVYIHWCVPLLLQACEMTSEFKPVQRYTSACVCIAVNAYQLMLM